VSYQVRHKRFGVFQGVEVTPEGAAMCYYPAADMPEMGFCEFTTMQDAIAFVKWTLEIKDLSYKTTDMIVEPYDRLSSDLLTCTGVQLITMEHWERLIKPNG
jgi:hypothetical protein